MAIPENPYSGFLQFISRQTEPTNPELQVMVKAYINLGYSLEVSIAQVLCDQSDQLAILDATQLPPETDFEAISQRSALITEFAWPAQALLIANNLLYPELNDLFTEDLRRSINKIDPDQFIIQVTEQESQRLGTALSDNPTWGLTMQIAIGLGRQRFFDFKKAAQEV